MHSLGGGYLPPVTPKAGSGLGLPPIVFEIVIAIGQQSTDSIRACQQKTDRALGTWFRPLLPEQEGLKPGTAFPPEQMLAFVQGTYTSIGPELRIFFSYETDAAQASYF